MNDPIIPAADTGASGLRNGRWECKICWTVYDPEAGDECWQIPPGIPFADLPEHWSCPNCGAPKTDFLAVDD